MSHEPWLRERADAGDRAFAFLVDEFGYRIAARTVSASGFGLDYCGADIGVQVTWHFRDPLTVWLVRLERGAMPARTATGPLDYFDLEEFLTVSGHEPPGDGPDLYAPGDDSMAHLASRLRACGDALNGGALDAFPILEQRVRDRAARAFLTGPTE